MWNQKGYIPEQLHVSRQEVARGVICKMFGSWHAQQSNDVGQKQRETRPESLIATWRDLGGAGRIVDYVIFLELRPEPDL